MDIDGTVRLQLLAHHQASTLSDLKSSVSSEEADCECAGPLKPTVARLAEDHYKN